MKGQGGGGTARGGGKNRSGGGAITIKKSKARQCKALEGDILTLREALFDKNGKDKDVTATIAPAFLKYDRNGVNLSICFETKLDSETLDWAFDLVKENMESVYDGSGYGWDDDDKLRELSEEGTRFLVVRDASRLVGFVHFRFTVQGDVMDVMKGEPSLFVWDVHVEDEYKRKGVAKHLVTLLELIARQQKMKVLSIPIQLGDEVGTSWIRSLRGFAPDTGLKDLIGFDSELEGFEVFSKILAQKASTSTSTPCPTSATTVANLNHSSACGSSAPQAIQTNDSAEQREVDERFAQLSTGQKGPEQPADDEGISTEEDGDGYVVIDHASSSI